MVLRSANFGTFQKNMLSGLDNFFRILAVSGNREWCWNRLQVFNKSVQKGFFQEINKRARVHCTVRLTFVRDLRVCKNSIFSRTRVHSM